MLFLLFFQLTVQLFKVIVFVGNFMYFCQWIILISDFILMQSYERGAKDVDIMKNFFQGKLTFLHFNKGEEMAPTIGSQGGTLLVRKIPVPDAK